MKRSSQEQVKRPIFLSYEFFSFLIVFFYSISHINSLGLNQLGAKISYLTSQKQVKRPIFLVIRLSTNHMV